MSTSKTELLQTMFAMQDSFNKHVHEDWVNQNFAWDQAILVESAELIEHLGYKWWKHQEPDMDQVIMEMVDIWHFGMSFLIASYDGGGFNISDDTSSYSGLIQSVENDFTILDAEQIRGFVCDLVHRVTDPNPMNSYFCFESFFTIWYGMGKNFDDLYKMYIGKNALNIFRQNNGYKDGSYVKIWCDKEDNEYLTQYLKTASVSSELMNDVLDFLDDCYINREVIGSIFDNERDLLFSKTN